MKTLLRGFPSLTTVILFGMITSIILITSGCSHSDKQNVAKSPILKGDIASGGLFRMNIGEQTRSIFPHGIVDASADNLMNQVYEGLMQFDPVTEKTEPALAENFTVSPDGMTYTFHLRKGIRFHDDPVFANGKGREVKAADVVYCFTKLCEKSPHNQLYTFVIDLIKGAHEHYDSGTDEPVEGIRALDDYTVQFTLEYPSPTFLSILTLPCGWIFPKELYQYKDEINSWCIGTGPFMARTIKINDVVILERNKNYWRHDQYGNQLPYLDAIKCNYVSEEERQLELLRKGSLDLIFHVPYEKMTSLQTEATSNPGEVHFTIKSIPAMRVEYYGLQNRGTIFNNENVRKALNYAIDRQYLVDSILFGFAEPGVHGIVPPAMPGYPADSVHGYTYQPEKARQLLREAGYADGSDFPVLTLQINDGNNTVIKVADAVQRMITDCLNITVELSVLPRQRHYEQIENGKVDLWRDGWIADYANPENFLQLFYGELVPEDSVKASYLNTARFKDNVFDKYYEKSLRESDPQIRMEDYWHADQELINRAAVIPLYYENWTWLVNKKVKNLDLSGIGLLDLSKVYFSSDSTIASSKHNF